MTPTYIRRFVQSYLDCALWSSTDDKGDPLDNVYSPADLDHEAVRLSRRDCVRFIWRNRRTLRQVGLDPKQAGHDFWLARNGHGAGFWDRGLGEAGEALTKASKPFGEAFLYVGDDHRIYL